MSSLNLLVKGEVSMLFKPIAVILFELKLIYFKVIQACYENSFLEPSSPN